MKCENQKLGERTRRSRRNAQSTHIGSRSFENVQLRISPPYTAWWIFFIESNHRPFMYIRLQNTHTDYTADIRSQKIWRNRLLYQIDDGILFLFEGLHPYIDVTMAVVRVYNSIAHIYIYRSVCYCDGLILFQLYQQDRRGFFGSNRILVLFLFVVRLFSRSISIIRWENSAFHHIHSL